MTESQFLGMFVISVATLLGIIVYFVKAAWSLSQSITKLNTTLEGLIKNYDLHGVKLEKHDDALHKHDKILEGHDIQIQMLLNEDR